MVSLQTVFDWLELYPGQSWQQRWDASGAGRDGQRDWRHNAAVRRWILVWLRAWRSEPVVLRSPLPVESVRVRLLEGSISHLRDNFVLGVGECRVVGRVST